MWEIYLNLLGRNNINNYINNNNNDNNNNNNDFKYDFICDIAPFPSIIFRSAFKNISQWTLDSCLWSKNSNVFSCVLKLCTLLVFYFQVFGSTSFPLG